MRFRLCPIGYVRPCLSLVSGSRMQSNQVGGAQRKGVAFRRWIVHEQVPSVAWIMHKLSQEAVAGKNRPLRPTDRSSRLSLWREPLLGSDRLQSCGRTGLLPARYKTE